jgi:thioredoxin reductase (NADPH)
MFPVLTGSQLERVRAASTVRRVKPGEILFSPGDMNIHFFAVLSGRMEIVQPSFRGERPIVTHGPGEFTGEVNMIAGQQCFVLGRVTETGEFCEMSVENLRGLIGRDAELSELFMRAFILRRVALISNNFGNVVLLGSRHSAATLRLREFLRRNGYPLTYIDLETDKQSQELLNRFSVELSEIPVVICANTGRVLRNPTVQKLADCLGMNFNVDNAHLRDLVIVGAGPAGLSAAVYAASEGLDSLLIETEAPGGQAGSSSMIENYLGFPTGISGQELASRALHQAQKFGAQMMVAHSIVQLDCDQRPYRVLLDDGKAIAARAIVIATGAQYNRPEIVNLQKFEGQGVYYGATFMESQLCEGEDVIVVGGGNSAGQAAVFLSQGARKVYMLIRSAGLAETASRYLIQRIEENPAIELLCQTEITALDGDAHLERVTWRNKQTGESRTQPIRHVFIMTGASPHTGWLRGCLVLDDKGFILTGRDLDGAVHSNGHANGTPAWPLARPPEMLETSLPGVFAVGDVRAGNLKRVASAVGEGAIAIALVHRVLAEL